MISVVIPLYNQGKYLKECIASILLQTHKDLEVIIVDDASTDDSYQIAKQIEKSLPKHSQQIWIIRNPKNLGVSASRNIGAEWASGDYLCFVDADDKLRKTYLEKTYAQRNKADVIYTDSIRFGTITYPHILPEFDKEAIKKWNLLNVTSLIKKDVFKKSGGFDEKIPNLEDWEFYLRLSLMGFTFHKVPEMLFMYRKKAEGGRYREAKKIRPEIKDYIYNKLGL